MAFLSDDSYWQGTEIDPRFCKISEFFFKLIHLKVLIKVSTKTEKWRSAHARSCGNSSSKNEFQKHGGSNKLVIGLSKSILLIIIGFLIKFRVWRWIRNFKILFYSTVMSYESFFEKLLYDSYMTRNIYNIHIIWLQILFLIQWCKNFWDSPTQNFQMNFSPKCVGGIKISTSNSNKSRSQWWGSPSQAFPDKTVTVTLNRQFCLD